MAAADPAEPQALELRRGRTLTIDSVGEDGLLEIRGPSGTIELRIRMTEEGPVLEMETLRISLRAAESIDIEAKEFNVTAERSMELKSQGEMTLSGKADVRVDADGEVHVTGEMIYLN
jgi:hypothetical protein